MKSLSNSWELPKTHFSECADGISEKLSQNGGLSVMSVCHKNADLALKRLVEHAGQRLRDPISFFTLVTWRSLWHLSDFCSHINIAFGNGFLQSAPGWIRWRFVHAVAQDFPNFCSELAGIKKRRRIRRATRRHRAAISHETLTITAAVERDTFWMRESYRGYQKLFQNVF